MPNVVADGCVTIDWIASVPAIAIPVYQREYRWSQETCYQLLHDIRLIADDSQGRTHFIGSILASRDDGGLTLVDGQQRITTLMLLMAAIRDLAADEDDATSAQIGAILRAPDQPSGIRLQPHERHFAVVRALMASTPTALGNTTFEENYEFLLGELADDWRKAWSGLQRLEHVAIELGLGANPQRVFESLNSAGARLTDDELIHNYIHMGRSREQQDELERAVWLPIESATAGETREFWRDYLVATSPAQPDFVGDFGVYSAFARRYPDPLRTVTAEVGEEWVRYANRYGVLLTPDLETDSEIREQLVLVRMFEGGSRPLMLRVYDDLVAGTIDNAQFVETSERFQSMWVRRALVNLSRDIGLIGTICRELEETGYPVDGLIRRTPEDPQVRLALTHASVPHVGYVLRRIQKPPSGVVDLQIEHIYPQTPSDDWSGDGGKTKWGDLTNDQQAEFRTVLNTIGNLTLLEASLNQGAGNLPYHLKARDYYPRSLVAETNTLSSIPTWSYAAITARTKVLTEQFLQIWARPSTVPMSALDDLVRVVDHSVPYGPSDPAVFEYVVFEDQLWGDVHNVKALARTVGYTLWLRDKDGFLATELGKLIHETRAPRTRYAEFPDGTLLYVGWAPHFLFEALQASLTAFGLDDRVRAKLMEPA